MAPADFTGPSADEVMRDQEMARIMAQGPQAPVAPVVTPPQAQAAPPTQMAAVPPTTQTDVTAPMMPPERAERAPVAPAVTAPQPQAPQQALGTGLRVPGMPPSVQQTAQAGQQTAAAVQAQPTMNYQNILVAASQDPNALMRASEQVGGQWGRVYAATAKEQLSNTKNQQAGEAQGETAANTGRGVDRIMRRDPEPNSVGFYAKQYLLRRLGMGKEADELLGKTTFSFQNVTDENGQAYSIKLRGDGMAMAGYDTSGQEIAGDKLQQLASQAVASKQGFQKGEFLVDEDNMPFQQMVNPANPRQQILSPVGHTKQPKGRLTRSTQSAGLAGEQAGARAGGAEVGRNVAEQTGRVVTGQLPRISLMGDQNAPQAAPGAATSTAGPVPPGQVSAGGQGLRVSTPDGGVIVPSAKFKEQQRIREKAATEGIETAETLPRENIKLNAKRADDEAKKSTAFNQQARSLDSIIRFTEEKPEFFGAWIGGEAYRAFQLAQTDDAKRAALDRLAQTANISKPDRPRFQELVNDIRRVELAGITGSGLSASQLNTERESQRAVNAYAVSLSDTPQAARIQAEIAKAQVDYQRQYARWLGGLGAAELRQSPARLQRDFDDKIGDKIYSDLMPKLEALRKNPRGTVDFRSNQ